MPSAARSPIMRWTSALAPTSMPRVGSSRMSNFGRGVEPLGQHHLLLVAAGELGDLQLHRRRADVQPILEGFGGRRSRRRAGPGPARQVVAQHGQGDVGGDGHGQGQAQLAPVFGARRRSADRRPAVAT